MAVCHSPAGVTGAEGGAGNRGGSGRGLPRRTGTRVTEANGDAGYAANGGAGIRGGSGSDGAAVRGYSAGAVIAVRKM